MDGFGVGRVMVLCAALMAMSLGPARAEPQPAAQAEQTAGAAAVATPADVAALETPAAVPVYGDTGFYAGSEQLNPSEAAGREIWYKAAAGNGRFHTYVFQQRLGVLIDWYRVLNNDARDGRFKTWGLINDPDCCTPGSAGCPAKSLEETYGFDWCPGDDELLK